MTAPWPRLSIGQQTDPGRDPSKQENEDSLLYQELHVGHLLLVCDGMGGHSSGREASQLAVSTILGELAKVVPGADPGEALVAAIQEANRRVYAMGGSSEHGRPGSTCVAALIHPMGVEVAHLGDSRAYLIRSGQLWPLTRDHSMVREMVDAGVLRPEEAQGHPDSNKITRALGMGAEANVELRIERLMQQPGDVYILVSDGVSDVVRETDLQAMGTIAAEGAQLAQLCSQVVQLANARGGPDNTTILAAYVVEPGLRPEAAQQPPRRQGPPPTVVETTESPLPVMGPAPRNRPLDTVPGGVPVVTATATPAPPPAAPLATPLPVSNRPGAGATVKLAVHNDPPASLDRPTLTDATPAASTSRLRRLVIGGTLAAVGLVITALSLRALLPSDEEPPPLPEHPASSASAPRASGSR